MKDCRTLADLIVVELQIFCQSQIWLKFVGTSACRKLADSLLQTAFRVGTDSISAMLEKTLVYVVQSLDSPFFPPHIGAGRVQPLYGVGRKESSGTGLLFT